MAQERRPQHGKLRYPPVAADDLGDRGVVPQPPPPRDELEVDCPVCGEVSQSVAQYHWYVRNYVE